MSSESIHLNILLFHVEYYYLRLTSAKIAIVSSPAKMREAVAAAVGRGTAEFELYAAPPEIKLPKKDSSEQWSDTLPEAPFKPLPQPERWPELFKANDELHLVVVPRKEVRIRFYDTAKKEVRVAKVSLVDSVESIVPYPDLVISTSIYKAPRGIFCDFPSQEKEALSRCYSLDLSTLSELSHSDRLIDNFPWEFRPTEVLFIIDPPSKHGIKDTPDPLPSKRNSLDPLFRYLAEQDTVEEHPALLPDSIMLIGRTTENVLPPSLIDETLCNFRHNMDHIQPTTRDYRALYSLRWRMSKTYAKEGDRLFRLNLDIIDILDESPESGTIDGFTIGGQLGISTKREQKSSYYSKLSDYRSKPSHYYFQQVKNELTDCISDPNSQLYSYYYKYVLSYDSTGVMEHFNYPAILVCQIGPYLIVSAAVFARVPVIEQIACIPLHMHSTHQERTNDGARFIAALRTAGKEFNEKYAGLVDNKKIQARFPFPRSFKRKSDGAQVNFTYIKKRDRAISSKMVFPAQIDETDEPIFIKFTQSYSEAAHEVGVELGIAPNLLAIERFHEWYMVVMEDLSEEYENLAEIGSQITDRDWVKGLVIDAVESLHSKGFVHGDVREINIFISKMALNGWGSRNRALLLVDWDWAGVVGEAEYPATLNSSILRSEGACAGAKIEELHDKEMVHWFKW